MNVFKALFFLAFSLGAFCSCKVTGRVSQKSVNAFLNDTAVRTGHAGISIYDPAAKKYLYNYNAEKNFIPSSNVKLFTLYAGMKYLGDSIPGLRYTRKNTGTLVILPTGDPTFLHPLFMSQPVFDFLKSESSIYLPDNETERVWKVDPYAKGWAWDDGSEDYMPERSLMPMYGNVLKVELKDEPFKFLATFDGDINNLLITPSFFSNSFNNPDLINDTKKILIKKEYGRNLYDIMQSDSDFTIQTIPFETSSFRSIRLLGDTIRKNLIYKNHLSPDQIDSIYKSSSYFSHGIGNANENFQHPAYNFNKVIYSRPVDSLFRPMMFNSDNFFAEQTLLMVSNEKLGYMSDEQIIDTLLKTDFKDIPAKPRWVDGCGLSRYDLFSPKDFIYILNKLQSEFGFARMKRILPTGGQGTLTNYYESDAGFIYAKTGSMSNNVSLSGYLITKKNKLLIFSVIINNFDGSGKSGRRAIEKLIKSIRETN